MLIVARTAARRQEEQTMKKEIKTTKLVEKRRGQALTTSLKVAEYFEKRHDIVLRAIENAKSNLRKIVDVEKAIIPTTYVDVKGEKRPMYLLTRDGFMLVVMGFTGEKAMELKWNYIQAFNAMEQVLKSEWQRLRRTGIDEGRKPLTDAIQQFNLRDFADGDKNPLARQRYGALTVKSQTNIFGIPKGGRDTATGRELAMLYLGEETMKNALNKAYALGVDYKQAEQIALRSAKQILLLINGEIPSLAN